MKRGPHADLVRAAHNADSDPEDLQLVAGAVPAARDARRRACLPGSPRKGSQYREDATRNGKNLKVLYVTRDQRLKMLDLAPKRVAVNPKGQHVLVARDIAKDARLSYQLLRRSNAPRSWRCHDEHGNAAKFEETLSELELRVRRLDSGELPLEEALRVFEEGVAPAGVSGPPRHG